MEREPAAEQAAAVVPEREPERLGQSSWPARREPRVRLGSQPAKSAHRVQARERLGRPQQHRGRLARRSADDVHTGMESVDAVRVEASGGSEHRAVAWGGSAMGVGRRIAAVAEVGLDFHQADHQSFSGGQSMDQPTPDQVGCDPSAIPGVEASSQRGVKRGVKSHAREYRTRGIAGATRVAAREGLVRNRGRLESVGHPEVVSRDASLERPKTVVPPGL